MLHRKLLTTAAVLTLLPLAGCNWFVQELQLYKFGMGEKDIDYIEEGHRPASQQPSKGQLMAERDAVKRKQKDTRFGNDIFTTDPYNVRIDAEKEAAPEIGPPRPGTHYRSPL